jgi:hypothetical protein
MWLGSLDRTRSGTRGSDVRSDLKDRNRSYGTSADRQNQLVTMLHGHSDQTPWRIQGSDAQSGETVRICTTGNEWFLN